MFAIEHGAQLAQLLQGTVPADDVVLGKVVIVFRGQGDGRQVTIDPAGRPGRRRPLVGHQSIGVLFLTADTVDLGHKLGMLPHGKARARFLDTGGCG